MQLSVILPAHNPNLERLRRVLVGLCAQTLPLAEWELLFIDNASTLPASIDFLVSTAPANFTFRSEPVPGLTQARLAGLAAARGQFVVFVDDDNILADDYLARVITLLSAHPKIGALGGKCVPEFEQSPPAWTREFYGLLALRDLGDAPMLSAGLRPNRTNYNEYPLFAPMGAGMALRRAAWTAWVDLCQTRQTSPSDRRGNELTSSGDNDIILALMRAGWEVGYFPELTVTHLIPASRLEAHYLARLNRGIQKSWQRVLAHHDASPWPALTRFGAALRKFKAWFSCKPWTSPAARVRWQGACGHFDGRIAS